MEDTDSIIFMKFAKKLLIEEKSKINNLDITLFVKNQSIKI